MSETMELLFFGDQTDDYRATFHQLLRVNGNPLLTAFLDEASAVLREEISQLPHFLQAQYPGFTSIVDLIARYSKSNGPRLNGLESALTCVSQISCFYHQQASPGTQYPLASSTRIVGSCIGLLSGAAVSLATSLLDLLPFALTVLRIAFRVGLIVERSRNNLEVPSTPSPSWSAVISGLCEEDVSEGLRLFHTENVKALTSCFKPSDVDRQFLLPTKHMSLL